MSEFEPVTIEELIDTVYGAIANFVTPVKKKREGEIVNYVIPSIPLTEKDTFFLDGDIPADPGPERSKALELKRSSAYAFAHLVNFVPSTSLAVLVNEEKVDDPKKLTDDKIFSTFDEFRTKGYTIPQAYVPAVRDAKVVEKPRPPEVQKKIDDLNALLTIPDVEEEDEIDDDDTDLSTPADETDDLLGGLDLGDDLGDIDLDSLDDPDGLEEDFLEGGEPPKPTKLTQRYTFFKNRYEAAEGEMILRMIEIDNDPKNARFRAKLMAMEKKKLRRKMKQWQSLGKKDQYERIENIIAALEQGGMVEYRDRLQEKLENLKFDVNLIADAVDNTYYTALVPNNIMKAPGWTKVSLENKSARNHFNSKDTSFSGRVGFPLPYGIGVNIGASHSKNETIDEKEGSHSKIEFEITQALITRPWLDLAYLKCRKWSMSDPTTGESLSALSDDDFVLSDGKFPDPDGVMQAYTTAVVLVRKVSVQSSRMKEFMKEVEKKTDVDANVSFAGFSMFGGGGKYSKSETDKLYEFDESTGTLHMLGTHIVAFRGAMLPKAPNPNFEKYSDPDMWV